MNDSVRDEHRRSGWRLMYRIVQVLAGLCLSLSGQAASPLTEGACRFETPGNSARIDVRTALELALCRNAQVRSASSAIRVQEAKVDEVYATYSPTANAALSHIHAHATPAGGSRGSEPSRTHRASLHVNWRVWDFGTRKATLESARQQLGAALADADVTRLNVAVQTLQAYLDAQTAWAAWRVRRKMRTLSDEIWASARRRQKSGLGSNQETLQAEAARRMADLQAGRSHGSWLEAQATLAYLMGLPAGTDLHLEPPPPAADMGSSPGWGNDDSQVLIGQELNPWLADMRARHPAIRAMRARWRAARARTRAAQAEGLPTLDLSFDLFDHGRHGDDVSRHVRRERVVGLTLRIPLFEGFAHQHRVRAAHAEVESARIACQDTEEAILLDLIKTHTRAQTAWRNLGSASALQLASEASAKSVQRQFERGVTDMLHATQAQSALAEARMDWVQAWAQWESARLQLLIYEEAATSEAPRSP